MFLGARILFMLCALRLFSLSLRVTSFDRIYANTQNRKVLSETLSSKVKEEKRRNDREGLERRDRDYELQFHISPADVAPDQFVVSLFAKSFEISSWKYVRDSVFNHSDSSKREYELLKAGESESSPAIHNIISKIVYGNYTYGYPRIMNEIVEAVPELKKIPARSLMLGFDIRRMGNNVQGIERLRTRIGKVRTVASMLSRRMRSSASHGLQPSITEIEMAQNMDLSALHSLNVTNIANVFDLDNDTDQIPAEMDLALHPFRRYLEDLLTNNHSTRVLKEIELTSDGSLLSIPMSSSSASSSSSNASAVDGVQLGGAGVFIRFLFMEKDCNVSALVDDELESRYWKYDVTKEMMFSKMSGRSKRKQKSAREYHRIKIKAIIAAQKELKKQGIGKVPLSLNWKSLRKKSDLLIEDSVWCVLHPFYLVSPTYPGNLTSLDVELTASIVALSMVQTIESIVRKTSNQSLNDVRVVLRSDSKASIRQLASLTSTATAPLSSTSSHRSRHQHPAPSPFRKLLEAKLKAMTLSTPVLQRTYYHWISGHPENKQPLCKTWSKNDWAAWQADWLSQQSLAHVVSQADLKRRCNESAETAKTTTTMVANQIQSPTDSHVLPAVVLQQKQHESQDNNIDAQSPEESGEFTNQTEIFAEHRRMLRLQEEQMIAKARFVYLDDILKKIDIQQYAQDFLF